MHLKSLSIIDYKNIEEAQMAFCPKLNCFLGDNGAGKTNLLDAIYYLSFTKSFFNAVDTMNIRYEKEFFMIRGLYDRSGQEETVSAGFKANHKKQFKLNKDLYKRLSDHIGTFPLVMVSPSDSTLITGGGEERRRFVDGVIAQYDKAFLESFLRYNRVLIQRNTLLKQFAETRRFDPETLAMYDDQLATYGQHVLEGRKSFIERIIPVFQYFYEYVSGGREQVALTYDSTIGPEGFQQALESSRSRDLQLQYTTLGPHRDDLSLLLGEHPMKKTGSQGQNKTYLIALKFAQFEFMKTQSGMKPILLLDDIFDKLDSKRVGKILELVSDNQFGQIFITDTNQEHLDNILKQMNTEHLIFSIANGTINPES